MAQEKGATRLLDKRFLSIAIRAIDRQSVQDKSNQAKPVLKSTRPQPQVQAQPQLQPQPPPPPQPLLRSLPVELSSSDSSAGTQSWSGGGEVGSVVVGTKATRPPIVNKKFLSNTIRDVDCHNAHNISERERAIENAEKREREREKSREQSCAGGGESASAKRMRREDERERKHWQRRKEQAVQAQQNGTSKGFQMTDESQPVSEPEDGYIDLSSYDDAGSKVKVRVDKDDDDDDDDSSDSSSTSSGSSNSASRKQSKKRKREDKAREKKERKKERKKKKKAEKKERKEKKKKKSKK